MSEDRGPPETLWREPLASSRLLEYELRVRVHALGLGTTHGELVEELVARIHLVELAPEVLERALEPFPVPVRTLDALHLASMHFLTSLGQPVALASYDDRLTGAATRLGFALYPC